MARSAKTGHVMSLVGDKSKGSSPQNDREESNPQIKETSPIKIFNPALIPIENEQRSNPERPFSPPLDKREELGQRAEEEEKGYIEQSVFPSKEEDRTETPQQREQAETPRQEEQTEKPQQEAEQPGGQWAEDRKNAITAIVPDLINQELEAITKRFHIEPTDRNLWQLTKAALETIRPEFSRNAEEYGEKCGRLRQKVILEMTKAAIRISKGSRK